MNVLVINRNPYPDRQGYHGIKVRRVTIADTCPVCDGPRGEPQPYSFYEDGEWYEIHKWVNPCGHIDYYDAVLQEARVLATQTSGYWLDNVAVTDPSPPPCPICNDTQENCPTCPPDDAQYTRMWRAGAFDDELEGFAEADFYTLTERVMSGE